VIRWWPPVAVTAMVILGVVVGKASTPLDDWFLQFRHTPAQYLLLFTNPTVIAVVMMVVAAVAFDSRRERLALIAVLAPVVAWVLVQVLKRVFGRLKEGYYAYPSGHVALTVVIVGMAVLVVGVTLRSVVVATVWAVLALLGQGVTFHYFTDTLGGVLLGTAVLCVAALIAGPNLTRVNPLRPASQEMANIRP
jgi:membrane-associated phospholipid phosphatase